MKDFLIIFFSSCACVCSQSGLNTFQLSVCCVPYEQRSGAVICCFFLFLCSRAPGPSSLLISSPFPHLIMTYRPATGSHLPPKEPWKQDLLLFCSGGSSISTSINFKLTSCTLIFFLFTVRSRPRQIFFFLSHPAQRALFVFFHQRNPTCRPVC